MAKKSSGKTAEKNQSTKNKSVKTGNDMKNEKSAPKAVEEKENELANKVISLEEKVNELQDKYLRLSAEYDNYRKRTLKEKVDLLKSAGESTIVKFLPVMDDLDRAMLSLENAKDIEAVKTGMGLIYNKLKDTFSQQGVKEIEAVKQDFDTDLHEAITKIPAPKKNLKGKVVDVIEKGYYLNDKVIRFSKVIIGE
ncbi:MAG: nucleotide exchange factor GrpE [Bacteroidales bacterium]|nr:nucleotide exchange factor GrpE [Bacteroidales bacterium]MCF8390764.1 nucleotide exchange factor GrpE [Bacteroidales bacterium]